MSISIVEFQPTPNPNALKCVVNTLPPPSPSEPMRSYRSREQAGGDALAAALLSVPGVTGVLISGGWLTINKSPDARWEDVKKGVRAALIAAG